MSQLASQTPSSRPGSSRASTDFAAVTKTVDGRDKPGHDGARSGGLRFLSAAAFSFILAIMGLVGWVYSLGPLPVD